MRTERDFLGKYEIPDDVYYGINSARGQENFYISDDKADPDLIKTMVWVKKSCAAANLECGSLDKKIADAIMKVCGFIADGGYEDQFIVNPIQGGGGTSFNMNANEVIANCALEYLDYEMGSYHIIDPLTHVNMSQSTNDVFPTALNLALIIKSETLVDMVCETADRLLEKSREFETVMKMGRTHLNAASPISFGQCFDAYASVVSRDAGRIHEAVDRLRYVPLGGTVVGTGLNTTPEYREAVIVKLRNISGINVEACQNLADGIQNVDAYVSLSSAFKSCMLDLSKIASDLRLSGSYPPHGLGDLRLPPRQMGSSIIPDKVNPVIAELINQVSFLVCGYDLAISMAAQAGQFELNVFKPTISYCLLKSTDMMAEAIYKFNEYCLKETKVLNTGKDGIEHEERKQPHLRAV